MKIKNKKYIKEFNKNSHQINFWWENGGNFIICDFADKRILSIGLAVGDAVGNEIRDSYKEHKAKSRKQDPSVIVTDDTQEVKVSND